jgi:hypothetical protein
MFIKDTKVNNNGLVFVQSKNVKTFPCGRRRSGIVDPDNNSATVSDRYYIPFDPEARLNTEANNRKHSGLNGFKQKYLYSWDDSGSISFVLAGYLFEISSDYNTVDSFGKGVAETLALNEPMNKIFVNIKLADMTFFEGATNVPPATTKILRDQYTSKSPLECLDQPANLKADKTNPDSYYFFGLSFSSKDLESEDKALSITTDWVSMQLLDYDAANSCWKIHEASRLPVIDHGDERGSVNIPGSLSVEGDMFIDGTLTATNVEVTRTVDGRPETLPTVSLKVVETSDDVWQLRFYTE